MKIYDVFDYATALTQGLIDEADPEHAKLPTPCTDWNVEELVDHIFGVNGQSKAMAAGIDVAKEGSDPDPVGDDVPASYQASVASVREAFAGPAILETTLATPMGPYPGRVVFTVTSIEHLIHGWDLAAAIGLPLTIDPVVVGYVFRAIEGMPDVLANFREWGAYGAPLMTGDDVSPTARLLAELGRDSSWNAIGSLG